MSEVGSLIGSRLGVVNLSPEGGGSPSDPTLEALLGLPTLVAYFDKDWSGGLDLRSSTYLKNLTDRTNAHVIGHATESAQPTWGAYTPTGRRAATYNPSNSQNLRGASVATAINDGSFTIFTAARFDSLAAARALWSFGHSVTVERTQLQVGANGALGLYRVDTANALGTLALSDASVIAADTWYIITATFDASTGTGVIRVNGTQVATSTVSRSPVTNIFSIGSVAQAGGASNPMSGDIAAVVVCSSVLGSTPIAAGDAAMAERYKDAA